MFGEGGKSQALVVLRWGRDGGEAGAWPGGCAFAQPVLSWGRRSNQELVGNSRAAGSTGSQRGRCCVLAGAVGARGVPLSPLLSEGAQFRSWHPQASAGLPHAEAEGLLSLPGFCPAPPLPAVSSALGASQPTGK